MKVIAIDLDNTALLYPNKVRELINDSNNFIVIYTARRSDIRIETEKELSEKNIPFHALVMDKLRADVYIDDKNMGGLQWKQKK